MKVEIAFNPNKVRECGYQMEQILATLKRVFCTDGLRCTSEGEGITFEGNYHEDDFANMWLGIKDLINSSWFLRCASVCRWSDWSDNGEEQIVEDVLSQAHHLINIKHRRETQ